ncbi:MAG: hypothetical protein WCX65_17000 [bacterium]
MIKKVFAKRQYIEIILIIIVMINTYYLITIHRKSEKLYSKTIQILSKTQGASGEVDFSRMAAADYSPRFCTSMPYLNIPNINWRQFMQEHDSIDYQPIKHKEYYKYIESADSMMRSFGCKLKYYAKHIIIPKNKENKYIYIVYGSHSWKDSRKSIIPLPMWQGGGIYFKFYITEHPTAKVNEVFLSE